MVSEPTGAQFGDTKRTRMFCSLNQDYSKMSSNHRTSMGWNSNVPDDMVNLATTAPLRVDVSQQGYSIERHPRLPRLRAEVRSALASHKPLLALRQHRDIVARWRSTGGNAEVDVARGEGRLVN